MEFTDCTSCGKRIATTAVRCHHCQQDRKSRRPLDETDDDELTDHMSLEHGGYDDHNDFDYDNYVAEEFPDQADSRPKARIPIWVWITAWLLIIATLLPFVAQFLSM